MNAFGDGVEMLPPVNLPHSDNKVLWTLCESVCTVIAYFVIVVEKEAITYETYINKCNNNHFIKCRDGEIANMIGIRSYI